MTGWQGNEGGAQNQGGWNPQPDPYGGTQNYGGTQQPQGGQYGADPYPGNPAGNPYGANPYGTNPYGEQYGANPYGANPAYPGYQTGYGPPPPPPKRSKLPIVISVIAMVAVVGAVVTIVILNRGDDPSPTAGGQSTSSRPSTARSQPPSSRRPPSGSRTPPATKDGWTAIPLTDGGSYQVPQDWRPDAQKRDSGLGVEFDRGAVVGEYNCANSRYFRGFSASGEVQSKSGAELDLNKTVTDFANSFAKEYYGNPTVDNAAPKPTTVDGQKAATVTVKLTVTPTKPECEATTGEVAVVGVGIEEGGKLARVRMLVVVNDLAGGPATPPGLPDPLAEEILATLTLK